MSHPLVRHHVYKAVIWKIFAQNLQQLIRYRRRDYVTHKHAETIRYWNSKATTKKPFLSEEENSCEKQINLKPQNRISNINWCKNECECKLIATFAESFCLLLQLKSQTAREASRHSAFMGNCPATSPMC